ncbi:hypothetical protein F2Q68_00024545 [Brassica cretica]|uniref:Uncharacterized protein n=1 Tax=Brassica cretica TaxID=69181 RepID=A0A8S9IEJ6_BRACR|nr:hypothetical protein F2Q68_00024545 [Brassica cretica]
MNSIVSLGFCSEVPGSDPIGRLELLLIEANWFSKALKLEARLRVMKTSEANGLAARHQESNERQRK